MPKMSAGSRRLVVTGALPLAIASGLVLIASDQLRLPGIVSLIGLGGFLISAAVVAFVVLSTSRRDGASIGRSVWRGVGAFFRWLLEFSP